ncbi:MAG: type II toxin-antitoxin system RelE/ParE family toxin [Planctomycetes bacterium]|nr:type II toxin-antitoxin system RelE/ParE family toxin [Planctomycetota bacterium]
MKSILVVAPEAEAELAEAKSWYENLRPGLEDDFIEDIELVFVRIRRNPEFYGIICDDIRFARADRFPYGIFFRIEEASIVVLSVRHGSREPKWRPLNPP